MGVYSIAKKQDLPGAVIEPKFDSLFATLDVNTFGQGYTKFMVYFLIKNGESCPIGYNGVKFYED
jgi:hypothetical protein